MATFINNISVNSTLSLGRARHVMPRCLPGSHLNKINKLREDRNTHHECNTSCRSQPHRGNSLVAKLSIRAVESYDGTAFQLNPDSRTKLTALLASKAFGQQVAREAKLQEAATMEFTGILFQPTPWSINTPRGMPREFEQYLNSTDFAIINVPPNFMFQAKISNPSRLCAVFKAVPA